MRYLVSISLYYWRSPVPVYTTLTMLSSIMQNISSSLCTTILELWLAGAAESSVRVTKWLTITWHSSRHLITVSETKHTDHIHVIKHVTLHTVTHVHFCQALTLNNATIKWVAMKTQNCLLQKFVKVHIHLNKISLIPDLVYLCT